MAFETVRGARLAWQQMGDGDDVILVHGLATNRAFWFGHALQLSRHFRVTLFDLRGHGYSERTAGGYAPAELGMDILGLMDALGLEDATLVGHSYGGAAAIEAAVQRPDRVRALSILDARSLCFQPQMWLHEHPELTPFEQAIAEAGDLDWSREPQVGLRFLEISARHCVAGRSPAVRDAVTPFGEGRGAVKAARQWLALLDETEAWNELNRPGADLGQLRSVQCPVQLLYARDSRCRASGLALRKLWPQAQYEEIANAGHFFPISHPSLVQQRLLQFLAQPLRAAA